MLLPMLIRGELSFPQGFPCNLTSGGITIPATVPHSGRESFEGTAPLFKTTLGATPKIGDVPSDSPGCNAVAVLRGSGDG
jgi:hypothetical protein